MRLLFIVPVNTAANEPLVDELTLKMVRALREGRPANYIYAGHHTCICGAKSGSTDIVLPNGWVTNTLCVHYVAYHRDEVPAADLEAVRRLPAGINDLSLAKTLSGSQVIDLSALIPALSQLDDHSPAPPVPSLALLPRRPPPARPRELGLAPAARRLQANDDPAPHSAELIGSSGSRWPESGPVGGGLS